MDKFDFGLKESMDRNLTNFVEWSKEVAPELLPKNFDFNQESYFKDRELIKAYLQLNKKQYDAISEFNSKKLKSRSSKTSI